MPRNHALRNGVSLAVLLAAVLVGVMLRGSTAGPATSPPSTPSTTVALPTSTPPPTDPTAASDQLMTSTLDADKPGCSAAVAINGQVVWRGVRGLADVATQRLITPDTVFDAASVTKQFTAAAILLLAQNGRLATTDPVAKHLDGLPAWANDTTLDSLIHHTSGLPDLFDLISDADVQADQLFTQADALRLIATIPQPTPRRGDFVYSNTGYVLLAEVVRVTSGMPLPDFLQQRIFGPLGLTMTVGHLATVPGRATSYDRNHAAPGGVAVVTPTRFDVVGPSGIQTTPSELARWGDNYRTGTVGGRTLLDAQLTNPAPTGLNHYAAGLIIEHNGNIGHKGFWDEFLTEFLVSADRKVTVAVMCNANLPRALSTSLLELWT